MIRKIAEGLKGDIMKLLKRVVIKFNEIFTLGKCRVIFDIPP